MKLKKKSKVYFMGIGGTGMAAVAGLCQEAGYEVCGSDKGVYPPMSDMLESLHIPYSVPYAAENLQAASPDLVVVANALSRGNVELEQLLTSKIPYTSFPAFLGENVLANRASIVVAGTHGKTTTTSLAAYVLSKHQENPGFLIGGIARDFPVSFKLGKGDPFVIEGDEYDTAFFDKGPKFLHYRPKYVILNNLEFDHADIYNNLEEIVEQFKKLCLLIAEPRNIIANVDDNNINQMLTQLGIADKVTRVATLGQNKKYNVRVKSNNANKDRWQAQIDSDFFGSVEIETGLTGVHNCANIAQVVALMARLAQAGELNHPISLKKVVAAISSFSGVKRRLELLGEKAGVQVYEDFAHHPTAIRLVIEGFKAAYPDKRVVVAFEPANATGRRNILQDDFTSALSLADAVYIGKCPEDKRIAESDKMQTFEIAKSIGEHKARAFNDNEELLVQLSQSLRPNDAVIFMSPSSFSGVQHRLLSCLI